MRSILAVFVALGCSVDHVTAGDGEPKSEPDPDLIAAWSFDRDDGNVVIDDVDGAELTRVGASWSADGKFGGAYEFDGVDDYLEIQKPGTFLDLGTGDFTLTAWVKNRAFPSSTSKPQHVMGRGIGATPQPGYRFYFSWDDYHHHDLRADIADGSEANGFTPADVKFFDAFANQWLFVAASRRGNELACYLDGVLYNSSVEAVGDIDVAGKINDVFRIGALSYQALWPFDGWIDEVKIFRRALDEDELAELMQAR